MAFVRRSDMQWGQVSGYAAQAWTTPAQQWGPSPKVNRPPAGLGHPWAATAASAGSPTIKKVLDKPRPAPTRGPLSPVESEQAEALRETLDIKVEDGPGKNYPPIATFNETEQIPEFVMQGLGDMGIEMPMAIQQQALPILLDGHDLIGIARTGSGKTLAFLLPMIVSLEEQPPIDKDSKVLSPLGLVLAPTRELAIQIAEEAGKLLQHSEAGKHPGGMYASCVYGGRNRGEQLRELWRGCHIIAATPGRMVDYVTSGEMSLDRVSFFVLDEADRMLDMGFSGEVDTISGKIRKNRRMAFFSATWPTEVQAMATNLCEGGRKPVTIFVGQQQDGGLATRADIIQEVQVFDGDDWEARDKEKKAILYAHLRLVLQDDDHKVLVFVNSKDLAMELSNNLAKEGFSTDSMHGGRKQWERMDVLESFKKSDIRLLVATDVMGRGLDIPEISHIVLYDMGDVEDYVHRIGRTARGLSTRIGHALTLFEYNEKWPELAAGLLKVLENAGQDVPDQLRVIAQEVESGQRKTVKRRVRGKWPAEGEAKVWDKKSGDSWESPDWKRQKWQQGDGQDGSWKNGGSWNAWGGGKSW